MWYVIYDATYSTKHDYLHTRRLDKRATLDMLDNEHDERYSIYSITSMTSSSRSLDNEHDEQEKSSLIYRSLKHDFLMNCVQLILSLNLLLRLLKLQTLVIK